MPELPEVETTRRGIEPFLTGHPIRALHIHQPRLRWPVPPECQQVVQQPIEVVSRRAKYILMQTPRGHLIWHLGMSGSMRILPMATPLVTHEHIVLELDNDQSLRFRDPRRFGALLYSADDPLQHPLLAPLGPEPLDDAFNAKYLQHALRGRSGPIKNAIMDSHIVVGVGNIYASESLFAARINPKTRAGKISLHRLELLTSNIKRILREAIVQGGTTLKDFTRADGKPGYFRHALRVYAREGAPCPVCALPVKRVIIGQRATFYCTFCQH